MNQVMIDNKYFIFKMLVNIVNNLTASEPTILFPWDLQLNVSRKLELTSSLWCHKFCRQSTAAVEEENWKSSLSYKGQLISEFLFDILNFQKKTKKNLTKSALESKKWSNHKIKAL